MHTHSIQRPRKQVWSSKYQNILHRWTNPEVLKVFKDCPGETSGQSKVKVKVPVFGVCWCINKQLNYGKVGSVSTKFPAMSWVMEAYPLIDCQQLGPIIEIALALVFVIFNTSDVFCPDRRQWKPTWDYIIMQAWYTISIKFISKQDVYICDWTSNLDAKYNMALTRGVNITALYINSEIWR